MKLVTSLCIVSAGCSSATCDQRLRDMFAPGYMERENQLPFTVGYIFMAATNTQRLGNQLFKKKSNIVTVELLKQAAHTIAVMIDTGAGSFVGDKILDEQYNFRLSWRLMMRATMTMTMTMTITATTRGRKKFL
jgi:hypothetical protein